VWVSWALGPWLVVGAGWLAASSQGELFNAGWQLIFISAGTSTGIAYLWAATRTFRPSQVRNLGLVLISILGLAFGLGVTFIALMFDVRLGLGVAVGYAVLFVGFSLPVRRPWLPMSATWDIASGPEFSALRAIRSRIDDLTPEASETARVQAEPSPRPTRIAAVAATLRARFKKGTRRRDSAS
jgi:hypothetical protein